ncbi:MAG: hypothetical protein QM756_07810 [Polyangiaceae bacterium]
MSGLGKDARELIESALRDEQQADAVELARIRRRVLAAGAGASVLGGASKAVAALGKASLGPALKAFALGVSVTVLTLGIPMVLSEERAPRPVAPQVDAAVAPKPPPRAQLEVAEAVQAPSPIVASPHAPSAASRATYSASRVAEPVPAPLSAPAPEPTPNIPAPALAAAGHAAPPAATFADAPGSGETFSVPPQAAARRKSTPLVQELTLLEKVQTELRAGRGAQALALLDSSATPAGGQLQAERLAAEVFAACQAGDVGRARNAARSFLSRYPASPASGRVRGSCAGEEVRSAP